MTTVAVNLINDADFSEWLIPGHGNPLEIMPFEAVVAVAMVAVMRVWAEVSDKGEQIGESDDAVLFMMQTPIQIDQIAGSPGICKAMESVGWLKWDKTNHATFPGFLKHNTFKPKDEGAADRMRKIRARRRSKRVPNSQLEPNAGATHGATHTEQERNAGRNRSSESVSESTSSGILPLTKKEALSDDPEPPDGEAPPPKSPLMHAVWRYCDALAISNESTRYRIFQDCDAWARPEAFGPQTVADGLRWGIAELKPWKVVASRIRNAAEKAGWVPHERSKASTGAGGDSSERAKERRAKQSGREYAEGDAPIPVWRAGKGDN